MKSLKDIYGRQEELLYSAVKWSFSVLSGVLTFVFVLKLDSLL